MPNIRTNAPRFLIPNATSIKNPGDRVMLHSLLRLIKIAHPMSEVTIHSVDPYLYVDSSHRAKQTLHSWAVFDQRNLLRSLLRVATLLYVYVCVKYSIPLKLYDSELKKLVEDYGQTDCIVFVGGGYLHAKKGFTQSLNLLLQVFLLKFASLYKVKKIVSPISVGPFGYTWQEKLVFHALSKMNLVALREEYSFQTAQSYGLSNIVESSDHAFLFEPEKNGEIGTVVSKKKVIAFTLRPWLKPDEEEKLVQAVVFTLTKLAKDARYAVLPIVQVNAPEYGEDDRNITTKIVEKLRNNGISPLKTKYISSLEDIRDVYGGIDILIGMRMHSNIFAAIQGTPFIAISYEHKTEGISRQLEMDKYCIPCDAIQGELLFEQTKDILDKRNSIHKNLLKITQDLKRKETAFWTKIFQTEVL